MIKRLEIQGVHATIDKNLQKYVLKKIGRLDKYLSRSIRESAHAEIRLKETNAKKSKYTCDVTLHLPHEVINIKESTLNMFAAVDIVETKLKQKLKQYKDLHTDGKTRRHSWGRFVRNMA